MRPNWPLIAIVAGALLTVGVIVVVFSSSFQLAAVQPRILTVDDLATAPEQAVTSEVVVDAHPGCAWSTVDERRALGIWPTGFTERDAVLLDADGREVAGTVTATVQRTDEAGAIELAGDENEDYVRLLLGKCLDLESEGGEPRPGVDVISAIVG